MADSPMYRAFVEVVPEGSGFTGALTKQVSAGSTAAGTAGGRAAGTGFIGGFGRMVPAIGAALAAVGIGDLIGDAITNASDLQQNTSAVEQVYGDLGAKAIKAFAEGGAKAVGQSKNSILSASSLLGTFGKAAGLSGTDLSDFSQELITLGADLSAFANTTPERAVEALSAGLRGESEPLRAYGILLDDATLKARAMEMGLYDGKGPLTQQARILAAYGEIMAQTSDQQGQFARESDSLTGKQAVIAAGWENISAEIGTAFLPIAQEVVDAVVRDILPALQEFSDWLAEPETRQNLKDFTKDFSDALRNVADFFGDEDTQNGMREFGNFLRDYVVNPLEGTVGTVTGFFDILNGADLLPFVEKMKGLPGYWGAIYNAAFDAGFGIGNVVGTIIGTVQRLASEVGLNIAIAIGWFADLPRRIGLAVQGAGFSLFRTGQDLINGFVEGIQAAAGRVFGAVTDVIGGAIDWARSLLDSHSPSRVFADMGRDTTLGYAQGIESGTISVRNSARDMVDAAKDGARDSAAGFQNYGTVYTNDPWGVADEFEKRRRRDLAVAF